MSGEWAYQLRITLADEAARLARSDPDAPALAPLRAVLARHDARMRCQFDAFADYVAEAELQGVENYPLYAWTRATIEDPAKEAKYTKSFTLYVAGEEVYPRAAAEALERDLRPLVGGGLVAALAKHDTNPANNPQPPSRFRAGPGAG
jgi:hypothetical protein